MNQGSLGQLMTLTEPWDTLDHSRVSCSQTQSSYSQPYSRARAPIHTAFWETNMDFGSWPERSRCAAVAAGRLAILDNG